MTLSFNELVEITNRNQPENKTGPRRNIAANPGPLPPRRKMCYKTLRVVWISKKYLSILTYCEGDLILEVCDNIKYFKKEIKRTVEFYKEH